MRASLVLLFALVVALANAQFVDRFLIDDFTSGKVQKILFSPDQRIVNQENNPVIRTLSRTVPASECTGLIGCSRDLELRVFEGPAGSDFTVAVLDSDSLDFEGNFVAANPKNGRSIAQAQYDGADDSSNLNPNGLPANVRDFTEGGLALGVRFYTISDLPTDFQIDFISPNGNICTGNTAFTVSTAGQGSYSRADIISDIRYSETTGNCDFTNIGAVQIRIPSDDAVDGFIFQVSGFGNPDPSATRTPAPSASRTPGPSQTRTPAPSASRTPAPSQSPSRTPSPSGPCIQFCVCPSFTCRILYDGEFSNNDVDVNFRTSQLFFDDSDDAVTRIVYRDDDDGISNTGVTIPSVSVPSVSVPSVSVPSVSFPSVTVPSIGDDDDDDDNGSNGSGDSASSSSALCASVILVFVAMMM